MTNLEDILGKLTSEAQADATAPGGPFGDYDTSAAIVDIKAWAESCLPEEDRYMKLEVCKFCGGMQYNCSCSNAFNSAIEKTRENIRSSK